jgi:TetR/AcrR family transcriptional repressor of nem operon
MGRCKEFDENVVLQRAMELFWEQGYEKTSMNDLVETMGIHKKSLYDTFGDKHALYLKTIARYGSYSAEKLKSEAMRAATANQALQNIFDFIIDGNEDRHWGCFFVNAATEMASRDEEVKKMTEGAFAQTERFLAGIIDRGQKSGEFSCKYSAQDAAEFLQNTLLGIRVLVRASASKEKMHNIATNFMKWLYG